MNNLKITSVGEILFDLYLDEKKLGGAPFNFIFHVIKLTGHGNFISRVGNDDLGKAIIKFLSDNGIERKYIQIDDKRSTGTAIANLNDEKIPNWEIKKDTAYDHINPTPAVEELINNQTSCLYFGTLAQRNEASRKTIQSFFKENIKFFFDLNIRQNFYSKEIIVKSLSAANVLKLNIDELKLVNDLTIKQSFNIDSILKIILDKYGIDLICITLGEDGALLVNQTGSDHFKIKVEDVVDTVGAGDAYAAVLCIGYLKGWDIAKINKLANEFAAGIVKIEGALPRDMMIYENLRREICYDEPVEKHK